MKINMGSISIYFTAVLAALKITGVIACSWIIVFLPMLISILALLLIGAILLLLVIFILIVNMF